MAERKIVIDLAIDTANSANSLKEVKSSLKELRDIQLQFGEGTEEYKKASQKIGELRDKLNDASDTARVLSGNIAENLAGAFGRVAGAGIGAFQALEGAQAIFGEENKDLQKQMVKLQGLLNLSQGIKEFANIGQSAKDFKTVLATLVPSLFAQTAATEGATAAQTGLNAAMAANPIGAVVAALALLIGALVIFSDDTDRATVKQEILNNQLAKEKILLDATIEAIKLKQSTRAFGLEFALRVAEAEGKSELETYNLRKKLIEQQIGDTKVLLNTISEGDVDYLKRKRELSEQLTKLEGDSLILTITNERQKKEAKIAADNEAAENAKKREKERLDAYLKTSAEIAKQIDADSAYELESWARTGIARNQLTEQFNLTDEELNAAATQMREEEGFQQDAQIFEELLRRLQYKKDAAEEAAKIDAESAAELEKWANQQVLTNEERAKKEAENEKILQQQKISAVQNGLSTIANLAQAFAGKSVKSQERAFKIQKAANIASAVIDTYQSATAAYKSLAGIPIVGPALGGFAAAAAVAAGLANIKRIKEQQFNASGTGGEGANVSTGGGGGVPTGAPPTGFNLPTAGIPTGVTPTPELLGTNQNINANNLGTPVTTVRAIVVESDITSAQIRIQNFETSAQLGNDE